MASKKKILESKVRLLPFDCDGDNVGNVRPEDVCEKPADKMTLKQWQQWIICLLCKILNLENPYDSEFTVRQKIEDLENRIIELESTGNNG